jgi:predicted histidine transporter YuiF (NhaC family)
MRYARQRVLDTGALCLVFAGAYHVAAIVWREIDPSSSLSRHAVFVVINLCLAAGLWVRPKGFFWVFAALTAQQLHSHGRAWFRVLNQQHRIDWVSSGVLMVLPLLLWLLWYERRPQTRESP